MTAFLLSVTALVAYFFGSISTVNLTSNLIFHRDIKKEYPLDQPVEEVQERIFAHYDEMAAALRDADKLSRIGKVEALKESIRAEFTEEEQAAWEREIPVVRELRFLVLA